MSGRHRRSDRRGLRVPAVAAVLVALGLVLIAAGATTASRGSATSGPPPPLPVRVAPIDMNGGDPKNVDTSTRDEQPKPDKKSDEGSTKKQPKAPKAPKPVAAPVRLVIPRLSIDEPLVELGLTDSGHVAAPKDHDDPGWFTEGPRPGERGASIIAGHVDDQEGPAIFYYLSALQRGDTVQVERADGSTVTFDVTRVARHPQDDFPLDVFHADGRELRLITCGGDFTGGEYTHNVVVYAERR